MENTNNYYTYFFEFDNQFSEWNDLGDIELLEDLRKGDFIDFEYDENIVNQELMKQDFGTFLFKIVKRTFRVMRNEKGITTGVYILKLKPNYK